MRERGDVLTLGDHGGLWENMVGFELDIERQDLFKVKRKGTEIAGW